MRGRRTVGKLLIAEPMLGDPNFDRSVVLMVDHTVEGALGVVLNRPTDLEVATVLGRWSDLAAPPAGAVPGRPVEQDGVLALARRRSSAPRRPAGRWSPVVGDVGTLDLQRDPDVLAPDLAGVRFFAGYRAGGRASWKPSWPTAPGWWSARWPTTCSPATPTPCGGRCCAASRGRVSMLANFPAHPSMN